LAENVTGLAGSNAQRLPSTTEKKLRRNLDAEKSEAIETGGCDTREYRVLKLNNTCADEIWLRFKTRGGASTKFAAAKLVAGRELFPSGASRDETLQFARSTRER